MAAIRVLLVDDDPAFVSLIEAALGASTVDFKVETADCLANAAQLLSLLPFNIILLDLGLPDSAGIETVKSIQRVCDSVPIVVITGDDDDKIAMWSLAQGASAFLRKSKLSVANLLDTMQHAVKQHRVDVASPNTSPFKITRAIRSMCESIAGIKGAIAQLDECDLEVAAQDAVSVLRLHVSNVSDQLDALDHE